MNDVMAFAENILRSECLAEKLALPASALMQPILVSATDRPSVLPARLPEWPGRPKNLQIVAAKGAKVPALAAMHDPELRARILHGFANHELQAVELAARALLMFPDAPLEFRHGLLRLVADEQRHTQMYIDRLHEMGVEFGDYPVSGYFWNKRTQMDSPIRFVSTMSLTFENANLDHARNYGRAALQADDEATAALFDVIFHDEINHVRFGWVWLQKLKRPEQPMWEAWTENLEWPLRPAKARADDEFHRDGREAAGLDAEFIDRLALPDPTPQPRRQSRQHTP